MSQSNGFDLESDDGARRLLYLCAFLLFFMPYFQAFAGLWPIQLGNLQWRFQATGALSGILMLPFIGMSFGLVVARMTGNKTVSRVIGVVAAITTVTLVVAIGLFAMDALQLKKVVSDRASTAFNKAAFTASCTMLFSIIVFSILTFLSFRGPQTELRVTPPKTKFKSPTGDDAPGLLIGQDYSK
ncbi:MAG: hypothetical protein ACO1Q7_05455 [Gemmatimonas sp.]